MGHRRLYTVLLWLAVLSSATTTGQPARSEDSRDAYIVQVSRSSDALQTGRGAALRTRGRLGHVYRRSMRGFSIQLPPGQTRDDILKQPGVVRVERDLRVYAATQTTPTGINRIRVDKVDGIDDAVDVDIAIIDTGIDIDHPDLRVAGGRRFYTRRWWSIEDNRYDDGNGHGTHCAGIAAAIDNDLGVVGVAPGARLWAVRVLDANGEGYLSDVIAGIDWVTDHADTIEVANLSLTATGKSDILREAIQNSVAAGVVYVAAAGNDGLDVYGADGVFDTSDDIIPAAYPEVATISAMVDTDGRPGGIGPADTEGDDDTFAGFSNISRGVVSGNPVALSGAAIDLMMPAVSIRSCWAGARYATASGTSMAAPHAAGLAALYIAAHGRAANAADVYAIRQALIDAGADQNSGNRLHRPETEPDRYPENLGWAGSAGRSANNRPNADFTYQARYLAVSFSDHSTDPDGDIAGWDWSFGDGTASTEQNPGHTYAGDGTYTVTLTVTDHQGSTDTTSKEVAVSGNPSPTAEFFYLVDGPTVQFTDASFDDGTIQAWSWEFGDGTLSDAQDPDHEYAAAGTYTVTLTVTDDQGDRGFVRHDVTVTQSSTTPVTAHVTIELSLQRWWMLWRATAVVTLHDGDSPIAEADIRGHWEGVTTGDVGGATRADGTAVFRTPWLRARGEATFVVDAVGKNDQEYALSGQTSGTISGP
ncbi:MAG TPA: S8 family serine peptidase [Sedimentisphaerales bacterium]|nr:S8 family serine peptidase [Sedimentisphaerales bacterium]HRS11766.1 S8 family serine peptidase [Sedimentisphaerales bacterium]HRV48427.1 S8 family serine peptidase [Sedimentisphaerales bacterium]